jgi:hypothetical protein
MLSVVTLSVVTLSVVMLSVFMLSVFMLIIFTRSALVIRIYNQNSGRSIIPGCDFHLIF